jgi:hypothetical protein
VRAAPTIGIGGRLHGGPVTADGGDPSRGRLVDGPHRCPCSAVHDGVGARGARIDRLDVGVIVIGPMVRSIPVIVMAILRSSAAKRVHVGVRVIVVVVMVRVSRDGGDGSRRRTVVVGIRQRHHLPTPGTAAELRHHRKKDQQRSGHDEVEYRADVRSASGLQRDLGLLEVLLGVERGVVPLA